MVPSTAADSSVGTVSLATGSGMLLVGCRQGLRCEARASSASSVDAAEAALFCRLSPTLNPCTPLKGTAHNRVMPEAHFCIRHVRQRIDLCCTTDYLKKRTTEKILGGGWKSTMVMKRKSHTQQTDNSLDQKKDTMEEHCTEDGQDGRTLNRRWAKIGRIRKNNNNNDYISKTCKKKSYSFTVCTRHRQRRVRKDLPHSDDRHLLHFFW